MNRIFAKSILLALLAPLAAHAQTAEIEVTILPPPPAEQDLVAASSMPRGMERAELLDGWQTEDGARIAAIRIALDEGWKTYWRSPGEAGIPPQFNFAESQNVTSVQVRWPRPVVFEQNGMRTVGYRDEVVLPIEITPIDPSQPVALSADLDFGICHDVCVPVSVEVTADLQGPGLLNEPTIMGALSSQPQITTLPVLCEIEPISDGVRVTARIPLAADAPEPLPVFELASAPVWVSEAVSHREGDMLVSMAEFVPDEAAPFALDPQDLRITLLDGASAFEIDGCED
ncbi:protein-disulfide reductase DsbD family protein [Thioclava sp. A2]|uniref:protein-disulfide reductase DsbD domain-containing protein n=1 Tax=Thioclava sp. FCG-A2 TaxID=3080562 RepID=UPI0029530BAE|nr:protein-disulfide reductase DsbD domain-containing protein [Thioclava sp. A2]MDV7270515.1 protein-disulfide reductase DsbD family protein [Thioclava sp. A2]